jgi:diguanylate cyclase (GGDEF)-like protein
MNPHESPEVLIVEDDADVADLLSDALGEAGFRVRVARTGPEALARLRERAPDIVLLDQQLPGLSGSEVCRRIRRAPGLGAVPVVMLTALSQPADQVAGLDAGADDYVTKPFHVDGLTARLRSHIRRSRRERQLNPLTGLPGNLAIDDAIEERLASGEAFSVAWIDLDNFKVYNDRYGFFAGDGVIEATGQLVAGVMEELDADRGFAGHIGGDDFVLIVPLEHADEAGRRVVARFDAMAPDFYSDEDRARGFVAAVGRTGDERAFPLMSVTVAIVPCPPGRFRHPGEIAHVAGEIKQFLKQRPGSAWLVDRRAGDSPLDQTPGTPTQTAGWPGAESPGREREWAKPPAEGPGGS